MILIYLNISPVHSFWRDRNIKWLQASFRFVDLFHYKGSKYSVTKLLAVWSIGGKLYCPFNSLVYCINIMSSLFYMDWAIGTSFNYIIMIRKIPQIIFLTSTWNGCNTRVWIWKITATHNNTEEPSNLSHLLDSELAGYFLPHFISTHISCKGQASQHSFFGMGIGERTHFREITEPHRSLWVAQRCWWNN